MKNWKQYKASAFTIIVAILGFMGFDKISNFIEGNADVCTFFLTLIFIVFGLLIDYIIKLNDWLPSTHIGRWKHPILIIDDNETDLGIIMDYLKGYDFDIVTVKDITDYRIAESFEIIIGDVWGIGASGKDSISVLNTIKEKYPYKIVLAMSSSPATCSGLLVDDVIISKENRSQYPDVILKKIRQYSSKLDDYNTHWEDIRKNLNNKSEKEMVRLKNNYYQYIRMAIQVK